MKAGLAVCLALAASGATAGVRDIAGVKVPESVSVDGKELKLNGAGIRKKFIIKVYVGALYLEAPMTDANAISSAEQVKCVHMHMLREVGKDKILGAFKEGFENNSKDKASALVPMVEKLLPAIPDLKDGDDLVVTYRPGKGTTVGIPNGKEVTVEGKDFGDAIFRNWLGPVPADGDLKAAMLAGGK